MQLGDRPAKALLGQLGNWFVQRRGLECQVVRFGEVALVGRQGLPWFHSETFLASVYPDREVGHSRRPIERDVGQVPKSRSGGVEQRTQDTRSCLFEVTPELRLVAAQLGLHIEELDDHCTIKKVGPRRTEVGNRIEHNWAGSVEDSFVGVVIKSPAPEAAASSQSASRVC